MVATQVGWQHGAGKPCHVVGRWNSAGSNRFFSHVLELNGQNVNPVWQNWQEAMPKGVGQAWGVLPVGRAVVPWEGPVTQSFAKCV